MSDLTITQQITALVVRSKLAGWSEYRIGLRIHRCLTGRRFYKPVDPSQYQRSLAGRLAAWETALELEVKIPSQLN